jgi:SAM-dependent methyltransferase
MADDLRHRSRSFGRNADLYDQTRPTYPPALIAELLADDPTSILDVGCGTAIAARLLTGAGRTLVGVEPDEQMAAIARAYGVGVEIATFEGWDPAGRRFDLLTSGQAWHWVDPVAGAAKAAEVLRPGGRFAAFWNGMHHVAPVQAVFDEVYGRHAPDLLTTSVALAAHLTVDGRIEAAGAALADGPFRDVNAGSPITYEWRSEYTAEAWIGLLRTHSDHEILGPSLLEALLTDLRPGLAGLGPSFPVDFRTDLLRATRR